MNVDFQKELVRIWEKAVDLYREGHQSADSFPIGEELPFLSSNGLNRMDIFDFAEDWACEGTPDLATFLLIHEQRRDYFIEIQKGVPSGETMDSSALPAKSDEIEGIRWLPRIIPKARAKLRGELPTDTMYCCGGDRNFFQENDVHPAEFLRIVKRAGENDQAIIDWVVIRRKNNGTVHQ
jgi:hypothetical protein